MRMILLIISLSAILSSCLTLPTAQTGRTLGEDKAALAGNLSHGNIVLNLENKDSTDTPRIVFGQIRGQFGYSDKLDLGMSIDNSGFIGIMAKYRILGSNKSPLAVSLGVEGGSNVFAMFSASYISVPIFISIHPFENWAFYSAPRYILSSIDFGNVPFSTTIEKVTNTYIAYNLGFMYGQDFRIGGEITYYDKFLPANLHYNLTLQLSF